MDAQDVVAIPEEAAEKISPISQEELLQRVLEGAITPLAAEQEADRLGIGPLVRRPEPALYDPMSEAWWTLPMTIAWIVWRTPQAVREQWDAYRLDCSWWVATDWTRGPDSPVFEGFTVQPMPTACWPLLALREDYPRDRTLSAPYRPRSPREAKDELWDVLGDGAIEAEAVDLTTRERLTIPTRAWKDLEIYTELWLDQLRWDLRSRKGFEDVQIRSSSVMDVWPARMSPEEFPPLVEPGGSGFMPLSAAAQWITSSGGTRNVGPDPAVWDDAYRQLVDRIASVEVAATGVREAQREQLKPSWFGGMRVFHPIGSEELGGAETAEMYLWANPYSDDDHWVAGFSDDLRIRHRTVWSKLMVSKADIARWWPKAKSPRATSQGRPSDKDLLIAEFERRCRSGEALLTLAAEARELSTWIRTNHTDAVLTQPVTIQNNIRDQHRRFRKSHERK